MIGDGADRVPGSADAADLDWDGAHGEYWVREQRHQDRTLAPFVDPLLDAAGVVEGSAVLDVGCGCGATTRAAAARGARRVLGVDLSGAMLGLARRLAREEGAHAAEFVQADVQTHPFERGAFDAAISRFGVMFFADPAAAFRAIASALRPGATLAFLCWQPARRNPHISLPVRTIVTTFPGVLPRDAPQPPFSMSEPDEVEALLTGCGFGDVACTAVEQQLRVGDDPDEALRHYLQAPMPARLLAGRSEADIAEVTRRIRDQLAEHAGPDGVRLGSAAWLVTARRTK